VINSGFKGLSEQKVLKGLFFKTRRIIMNENELSGLVESCCRVGFASINDYEEKEQNDIKALLPATKTVIIIAHHITHSLEWVWFKFPAEKAGEICPADIHTKSAAERISYELNNKGYKCVIPPYPGISGVMFKTLAAKTGMGQLGKNYLLMNADWGPWMHLRAIFTNAVIEHKKPAIEQACNHCGKCIEECPSGAIMENDFDGLKCRAKMRGIRDSLVDAPYIFECEQCLRACPIGEQPREVVVSYGKK
jgi:epoxyqueuosine reductase QueG